MTRVLGLDPSLTSFGGAVITSGVSGATLYHWKPSSRLKGEARLDYLVREVTSASLGCDLFVIEGIAGSGVQGVEQHLALAGLHWVIRLALYKIGVPCVVVQPSLRAKYVTGNGRAGKDDCLLAVERRFPGVNVTGNDTADAFTLCHMAADHLGFPLAALPAAQRAVLTSVVPAKKKAGRTVPAHPAIDWPSLAQLVPLEEAASA